MFGISSGILLALAIIALFIVLFTTLQKLDLLEAWGLEMGRIFLTWKTKKGREFIDRTAKKRRRFWKNYGNLGLIVVAIAMVLILFLIVWSAYLATSVPADEAPSVDMVLAIPGVNPLIPIWYGIAGLAIAIVVHEFSHGILARVAKTDIKSLGLAFLVVPIGAFVEPDEDQMEALPKIKRERVYAVGPTTNIILAIVLVLLFSTVFMAAVSPKEDGVIVSGIGKNSPAKFAGIDSGEQIMQIGGVEIESTEALQSIDLEPMQDVRVSSMYGEKEREHNVTTGLVVMGLSNNMPAEKAGLEKGDIIAEMDGTTIRNLDDFHSILDNRSAGDPLSIEVGRREDKEYVNRTVDVDELADKYEAYEELYPSHNKEDYKGEPYLGVVVGYTGVQTWDVEMIPQLLSSPFAGADSPGDYFRSSLQFIALPFLQLSPLPDKIAALYEITGPLSFLPDSVFWTISNMLYWVFWLNLMVGLFNALPAVPLDGGHIFNDWLDSAMERANVSRSTREKLSSRISMAVALLILGLLLWQLIGPRVA